MLLEIASILISIGALSTTLYFRYLTLIEERNLNKRVINVATEHAKTAQAVNDGCMNCACKTPPSVVTAYTGTTTASNNLPVTFTFPTATTASASNIGASTYTFTPNPPWVASPEQPFPVDPPADADKPAKPKTPKPKKKKK